MATDKQNRRLAAILSADVVGYSRLMRANEAATVAGLKHCISIFQDSVEQHGGRIVDTVGDSVLAEFSSAVRAAECSLVLQQRLEQVAAQQPDSRRMHYRIGINSGDVISEGSVIYGDGVNVAARMEALADPGGVCLSGAVYNQIKDKVDFGFEFIGNRKVKNIQDPIPVYKLYADPANVPHRLIPAWFKLTRWSIATALLFAVVAGSWAWLNSMHDLPRVQYQTNASLPALVVLPFTNSNADKKQEYFSDGITDDLINDLSQYSGLHVIARRSAYIYKQRSTDIQTIARDLGVRYVLDGDVRRDGNRIRINVQLIDASNGVNIWAQRFDRETEHIFEMQDGIRKSIFEALSVTLTKEERNRTQRRYTESFAAYDLFLLGQAQLVTRASATDSKQAQELMERAITLDPNFARAYAALALIHSDAYRFGWSNDPEITRQQALKIGERAIELDNQSPQAYWILGYIYLFLYENHDKAIDMAKKATELAPNDMDAATVLAVTYAFGDEPSKAKLITQDLMQRNLSYSALVPSVLGLANLRLGNYEESLAAYDKSLLINPSRIQSNTYKTVVLYRMGKIDEAEFQVYELNSLHPDFDVHIWAARQPFKDKAIVKGLVEDLIRSGVQAK